MVTPFDAQGGVDLRVARTLVSRLLDSGSDGVVVAGTTGEGSTLDDDEKCALFEVAVAEASGRGLVIAGTGSNDTAHSVALTERATVLEVDAVLAVTPYYNKPNRRGLIAHYEAIAGATDRPVILYNIPSRVVIDVSNELLAELAEIPNVAAVKQANPDNLAPVEGLEVLAGNDDLLATTLDMGGTGGILVASHIVGREMRQVIDEPDRRHEIQAGLANVLEAVSAPGVATNPIPIKAALNLMGWEVGGLRLPLVEASDDEVATIRDALDRQGLLSAV